MSEPPVDSNQLAGLTKPSSVVPASLSVAPSAPPITRGRKKGTRNPFPVTIFFDEELPPTIPIDTSPPLPVKEGSPGNILSIISRTVAAHNQRRKDEHDSSRKKIEGERANLAKLTRQRVEEEEKQRQAAKLAATENTNGSQNTSSLSVISRPSTSTSITSEGKSLMDLIAEGQSIPTIQRFNHTPGELTEDEQAIIAARVRIQKLQFAEYERKENQKKVHMIWEVHPNITEEEALVALEACQFDEEEVIANLTSFQYFRNLRIKIALAKTPREPEKKPRGKSLNNAEVSEVEAEGGGEEVVSEEKRANSESDSDSDPPVVHDDDDDDDEDDDISDSDMDIDEDEDDAGNKYRTRKHKKQKRMTVPKLKLDDAVAQVTTENTMAGWSTARMRAWKLKDRNPNAYYYRFNEPGEIQRNGKWTEEEKRMFFKRMEEFGVNGQWGIFSTKISGRVGYQCANYYRQLIEQGEIKDERYKIDAKGKAHFMFKSSARSRGKKRKRGDSDEEDEEGVDQMDSENPSEAAQSSNGMVIATTTTTTPSTITTTTTTCIDTNGGEATATTTTTTTSTSMANGGDHTNENGSLASTDTKSPPAKKQKRAPKEKVEKKPKAPRAPKEKKASQPRKSKSKTAVNTTAAVESTNSREGVSSALSTSTAPLPSAPVAFDSPFPISLDLMPNLDAMEIEIPPNGPLLSSSGGSVTSTYSALQTPTAVSTTTAVVSTAIAQVGESESKKKGPKRKKRRKRDGDDEDDDDDYRPSSKTAELVASELEVKQMQMAESNPLLGYLDSITSEQVVQPALSPYGHVLSYSTWIKCLQREPKNTCPLTKKPLKKRDLIQLTWENFNQHRDKLIAFGIIKPH